MHKRAEHHRTVSELIEALKASLEAKKVPTEAEVFEGFTEKDGEEEAETHNRIYARARKGEG